MTTESALFAGCLTSLSELPGPHNLENIFVVRDLKAIQSLDEYSLRFAGHVSCTSSVFTVATVLAIRLYRACPVIVSRWTVHKLFAALVLVGAKFTEDRIASNSFFAECAGVSLPEMNLLEAGVLELLDYNAFVTPTEFEAVRSLQSRLSPPPAPPQQHRPRCESDLESILSD
eukprot:c38870_g1_i1.p1 GENE.c38870_g1_i1~~c38870_g1_i1.p1  ORF type:complete len:173 (-),score=19.80 c38870_g1_i1:132-650(-)